MCWDSGFKPRLRPVEAFPLPDGDGMQVGVRDQSGLSDVVLTVSEPALHIMALMDGANSCEGIRRRFDVCFGQLLSVDTLQRMLDALEQAHLLEGPGFEAYYQSRLDAYRSSGTRDMPHAGMLGIDGSGDLFEEMLNGAGQPVPPGPVRGLVVPHLDYARGKPCYAAAYGTLRTHPKPDRVVILGTNHFGRSSSVVATVNDFSTPLGTTRTDVAFLKRLEAQCGDLRAYELDHLREHSIELQVAWLQYLLDADSFEMVPFLCPDPCGLTGTAPCDGNGVDLQDFARVLGDLIAEDDRDTLIVAGADLSHVGAVFGDKRRLDDAFLEEVREVDARVLNQLTVNDPVAFLSGVAGDDNATRVCSAGCIFALATALPQATGTVLRYHQAVDQPSQTCVTSAAVVFT
ncbi:MAG: AmmeMemoRadiSam system protein B [Phycisphaerae bacterium]